MKFLRDTTAIAWKDFQIIIRDRGLLMIVLLLPLIFGMLYSTVNQSQVNEEGENLGFTLSVYLVNEDQGEYGKQVVRILEEMDFLKLEERSGAGASAQVDQAVANGEKIAAIVIPANFSQNIDNYEASQVKIILDPSQEQFASMLRGLMNFAVTPAALQGEIRYGINALLNASGVFEEAPPELRQATEAQTFGVIMTQLATMMQNPFIKVDQEMPENVEKPAPINFFNLIMPGFTVMFAFFLVGPIGESLFNEKDEGTYRRLVASPVDRGAIIAGKMLAFGVFVILQVTFLFAFSSILGGLVLGNSPLGLVLVTLALALTVTTFGLMIAALSKSGKQADSIGMILGFALAGLGGCFLIGSIIPLYMQDNMMGTISNLTPHAHALQGYYILMNQGGNAMDVLPQVGILLGMSIIFFVVARWRLDWVRMS